MEIKTTIKYYIEFLDRNDDGEQEVRYFNSYEEAEKKIKNPITTSKDLKKELNQIEGRTGSDSLLIGEDMDNSVHALEIPLP